MSAVTTRTIGAPTLEPATRAERRRRAPRASSRTLISDAELHRGKGRFVYGLVLVLVVAGFTVAFVLPLYWMVASALKTSAELARPTPTFVPHTFHPESYSQAWAGLDIGHFFLNTAFYAFGGWAFQIVVDVAAAYALSKLRPAFGKLVLGLILSSLMLPASALLVPTYLTVAKVPFFHFNLLSTPWALWLPGAANAFNIYVLKRFFDQIPAEILDAASIDGAGRFRVLWSIVLPLSRPVLAVVSIFAVIGVWKDFLWPLLVLPDPSSQTLSVALSRLSSTGHVELNVLMAALVISSVPMVAIFIAFQRHILGGLTAGALKG